MEEIPKMSDNLIEIQDKRISELEMELELVRKRRDNLIDSNNAKVETMHYEIEKTPKGWDLTLPLGKGMKTPPMIKGLNSLEACVVLFSVGYKRSQYRNQHFELYDKNNRALFKDYRVYTEYIKKAEKDAKRLVKEVRRNRASNTNKVQSKVKKIDMRIFDRTY